MSAYDEYPIDTYGQSNENLDKIVDEKRSCIRHMRPPVFREEWEVWIRGEKYATADSRKEAYREMDEGLAERRQLEEASRRRRAAQPQPASAMQAPASQPARLRRFLIVTGLVFVIALGSIIFAVASHSPSPLYTYTGHTNSVGAVAWSPDGKLIASAGDDTIVRVWNATTGETLITYTGHTAAVADLAWSPNGKYIASLGLDRLQIWSVQNGSSISNTNLIVRAISWSPDNKYIVYGTVGDVEVLELDNQNTIDIQDGVINAVSWSPDGKYIAYGGNDGVVKIWNPKTNKTVRTIPGASKGNKILSIAWSHDSKTIAIGEAHESSEEYEVDGYTASGVNLFHYGAGGWSIAWSPNGKFIAFISTSDNSIEVNKIADGSTATTYDDPGAASVAWSPDGTRIATAGINDTVQVWQAPTS